MEDKNKTTNKLAEVSADTLDKLSSPDADIRQSGLIDIFEQHLPTIPADYVFKRRDRKFVEDALSSAFDLTGGVPRLMKWGKSRTDRHQHAERGTPRYQASAR